MPILLEIKFHILWAINPAFTFLAIQTDFCRFRITLIQYRDILVEIKKQNYSENHGVSYKRYCVYCILQVNKIDAACAKYLDEAPL